MLIASAQIIPSFLLTEFHYVQACAVRPLLIDYPVLKLFKMDEYILESSFFDIVLSFFSHFPSFSLFLISWNTAYETGCHIFFKPILERYCFFKKMLFFSFSTFKKYPLTIFLYARWKDMHYLTRLSPLNTHGEQIKS